MNQVLFNNILSTGKFTHHHNSPITNVDIYEDKQSLVSTSYDGRLIHWNLLSLDSIWSFQAPDLLNHASISPDGKKIAAACADGYAYVLNRENGKVLNVLGQHSDDVNFCCWIDSEQLITCCDCYDPFIYLWSLKTSQVTRTYVGHESGVSNLSIKNDGSLLASAGEDGTIRIWNISSAQQVAVLPHPQDAEAVSWLHDQVLTGGNDGVLRVWDISVIAVVAKRTFNGAVRSISISPSGEEIALGIYGDGIHIVDACSFETKTSLRQKLLWGRGIALSHSHLAVGSFGDRPAIFDARNFELRSSITPTFGANCVIAQPSTNRVLCGLDSGDVFDIRTKSTLYSHESIVNALAFSHCNQYALSTDYLGTLNIYDYSESAIVLSRRISKGPLNAVAYVSKEEIYVGGYDCQIYQVNIEGEIKRKWSAHEAPIKSLTYSTHAKTLISGGADGIVAGWKDRQSTFRSNLDDIELVNSVSSQHSSNQFSSASRDGSVRVWNATTGQLEDTIPIRHQKSVKCVCIHKDRPIVASGSYDGKVMISSFSKPSWECTFVSHHGKPGVSGISQIDETHFISVGWDGTYCIFDLEGQIKENASIFPT